MRGLGKMSRGIPQDDPPRILPLAKVVVMA
jgi:hypothetical protein